MSILAQQETSTTPNFNSAELDPSDFDTVGSNLSKFLSAFHPDPYEEIRLRAFAPKNAPKGDPRFSSEKIGVLCEGLECDGELLNRLHAFNETRGLYFVVNVGGDKDKEITRFTAWFVEADTNTLAEQHARFDACPLQPSIRVETRKSVHAYWLIAGACSADEWRNMQARLIAYFNGDDKIKNPSRVMRVPFFNHVHYDEPTKVLSFKEVKLVAFDPECRHTLAQMQAVFSAVAPKSVPTSEKQYSANADNNSFTSWDRLNAALGEFVKRNGRNNGFGSYVMKCPGHNGKSDSSLFHNPATGKTKCTSPAQCSHSTVLLACGFPAHPLEIKTFFGSEEPKHGDSPTEPPLGDTPPSASTVSDDDEQFNCSDMGNGYRFARDHRAVARFNETAGKWFSWDEKRWAENNGDAMRLAKQTVQKTYIEAAYTADEERRKALAKHAMKSEADARLMAMLHQAQCELPVRIDAFDADPFAFNCENGIVDLRTGELRPHDRNAMLTKLSPVVFDPDATAPKWTDFLNRIFDADELLIQFVQKAIGYSLTGDVSEQCLFLCHGTGANGKSVLLKTLSALVADYGQQVRTETLMLKKHVGVSNDIAMLRGARFISAVETDDGQRLAESTVKQLTGGDAVRARFLFQESFEFQPQFKIWLAANHKPEIRGTDHAIWRRIRLIPFVVTIPEREQNKNLDAELRGELPGIFAWAVRGCLAWQREGLGAPEAVTQATADYKSEMDMLGEFLADSCELGEHYRVTAKEIFTAYDSWCQSNGETKQTQRWLAEQLKQRGCKPERGNKGRFWQGIGLIRLETD
jgi:putative DNA primase/helicase